MSNLSPIGIFDSGVGGLSVLRAIHRQMPEENLLYFADQARVPYGSRTLNEVRHFSEEITRFLLSKKAKIITVACNTASAAALKYLRKSFPKTPFVGMEPAVKPAVEHTNSGVVGVLATPATFQGELYSSLVTRFANEAIIVQNTCPGLVEKIENGALNEKTTQKILDKALRDMLGRGVDTLVLGCTHYPFVIPQIKQITGDKMRIIDPAPAVARQVQFRLKNIDATTPSKVKGKITIYTTGDKEKLTSTLPKLGFNDFSVEGLDKYLPLTF